MWWMDQKIMARFEASYRRGEPDECWLWQRTKRGHMQYGVFYVNRDRRSASAHRLALEIKLERLLLPHEQALHSCDVPHCVNAEHLRVGTNIDNVRDKMERGRVTRLDQRGHRNHAAKLTAEKVGQIRALIGNGPTQREIAKRFGVSEATVSEIKNARHWRTV